MASYTGHHLKKQYKQYSGLAAPGNSWTASQEDVSEHTLRSPSDMVEKDLETFSAQLDKMCQMPTYNTEHVKNIASDMFSYYVRYSKSEEFQKIKTFYFSDKVRTLVQFLVEHTDGSADALLGILSSLLQLKGFEASNQNMQNGFISINISNTRRMHLMHRHISTARVEPVVCGTSSPDLVSTDLSPDYVALLLRWFINDQGQCIIKQAGGLVQLFRFLNALDDQGSLDLDVQMLPIVKNLLALETKESLHSPSDSVLYYAAMLELPQVTRELLSHPDISVSDEKGNGISLISNLIQKLDSVHDKDKLRNITAIINSLLEHPSMTEETVISCCKALLQLFSDRHSRVAWPIIAGRYSRVAWPMSGFLGRDRIDFSEKNKPLTVEKILVTLKLIHDTATCCLVEWSQRYPLLIGAFSKLIEIGQLHPDIMEGEFKTKYQKMFLSIVDKLNIDVNTCGFQGDPSAFGLGSQLIDSMNPPLLDAVVNSPQFDPGSQNPKGETVLHYFANTLMATDWDTFDKSQEQFSAMLFSIIRHPHIDTSVTNNHGLTALDIICHDQLPDSSIICFFVTELGKHPTATGAMIHTAICYLVRLPQEEQKTSMKLKRYTEDKVQNWYQNCVDNLCCHNNFDINQKHDDGFTVGHIAAQNGNAKALECIIQTEGYNTSARDKHGNNALYYIFENFSLENVAMLLKKCAWDFSVQNEYKESVGEYCANVKTFAPKQRLLGLCKKLMPQPKQHLALPCTDPQHTPVEREPRPVSLNLLVSNTRQATVVQSSDQNVINQIFGSPQKVYSLKKARKGKALIVSNHTFDVPWLKRLEGYTYDKDQLRVLWDQMGFDVYYPTCEDADSVLIAQEMESAVAKFSEELTEEDDCAVLCVLSHGGDGFVYGSDGKPVKIYSLLKHLDNQHCQAMIGKPKVVIIQACNGAKSDRGICHMAGPGLAEAAASVDKIPLLSDMVICSPSMPGYVSYVYKTPGQGSVFIKTLVQMLKEYAATEDFYAIHTRVNDRISGEIIPVENPDHTVGEYKQMSRFESSLRRHLYFMPCPGGKQGPDWN